MDVDREGACVMVEIPDGVAKREAERLRWLAGQEEQRCGGKGTGESPRLYAIADLLDPSAPTLREQVALALSEYIPGRTWDAHADAVLAVVADWLAAQPLHDENDAREWCRNQRAHDVALIRDGGAS